MKYDHIVRAGICGSGNTLVRLILAYLLGDSKITGTHRYIDNLEEPITTISDKIGIIIPYRDFRSIIASEIRKRRQSPIESNIKTTYKHFFTPQYKEFHKFRTDYYRKEDILWLVYARFFENYEYIADQLQSFLSITITQQQRHQIKQLFSLQANKRRILQLKLRNWKDLDGQTGLHGNHIGTGEPESWKTFFDYKLHEFITKLMLTELVEYGYEDKKS